MTTRIRRKLKNTTPTRRRDAQRPSLRSKGHSARELAFQHLVGEIFRLNGQLLATADRLAAPIGVSPAGWQTIAALRAEWLTASEISRRLGLRRQSVQHNVNVLLRQSLVELKPNPGHRRASLVGLTVRGLEVMAQLQVLQVEITRLFTRRLPFAALDLEAFAACLRQLREAAASAD